MIQLQDIVEILSSGDEGTTNALLKTKVLLFSIGKKDLAAWVDYEINGYPNESILPEYRVINTRVLVNANNGARSYNGFPIPLGHLSVDELTDANTSAVMISISQIEKLVMSAGDNQYLQQPIPLEIAYYYAKNLEEGYEITSCYKQIAIHNFTSILTQVRSRLLDFILELSDRVDGLPEGVNMMEKLKTIDMSSMFNNSIFGDNAVINFGNENSFNIKNEVKKNDFESLKNVLSKHGVSESDIEDLKKSIENDVGNDIEKSIDNKKYGPKVSVWFSKMIAKAADSTWNVGVASATTILTESLKNYFAF